MKISTSGLRAVLIVAVSALVLGTLDPARLGLRAQDHDHEREHGTRAATGAGISPTVSVQDALQRPFTFPFEEPVTLSHVCQYLKKLLRAPVVLDLAALDRQELRPDDQVQLQLEGVRLKTGLKLLLDQVGLTFYVVPEDNLLVLTDVTGSSETMDHVLSELKALHRDVHDLQDAVDDVKWSLGVDEEGGARMRKPTIIEEVPGDDKQQGKSEPRPQPPPLGGGTDRPRTRAGI